MQRWRPEGNNQNRHSTPNSCIETLERGFFPPLTSSKWYVGKLLPCSRIVVEVAVGLELQPLLPGVPQAVVDGRGDADLVADGDCVTRRRLGGLGITSDVRTPAKGVCSVWNACR